MTDIPEFQNRLQAVADPDTKAWFDNYLRGAISYRGVKTPVVTKILKAWVKETGLAIEPAETQLKIVATLLAEPMAEDKFAGILYLQNFLKSADPSLTLPVVEDAFANGQFYDWSTTDWLCVRVLDPMIIRHGKPVATRIAGWSKVADFWQRRASAVSFRHAVNDPDLYGLMEEVIDRLIIEDARFIQTGIGWLLADWSKLDPDHVAALVEKHFDRLSREVIDRHTKYLPQHKAYKARKR